MQLRQAEFDAKQLVEGGFGAKQLRHAGLDAGQLRQAGFDFTQLVEAGFKREPFELVTWGLFGYPKEKLEELARRLDGVLSCRTPAEGYHRTFCDPRVVGARVLPTRLEDAVGPVFDPYLTGEGRACEHLMGYEEHVSGLVQDAKIFPLGFSVVIVIVGPGMRVLKGYLWEARDMIEGVAGSMAAADLTMV